jgi:hypothetical protein
MVEEVLRIGGFHELTHKMDHLKRYKFGPIRQSLQT